MVCFCTAVFGEAEGDAMGAAGLLEGAIGDGLVNPPDGWGDWEQATVIPASAVNESTAAAASTEALGFMEMGSWMIVQS